jgi:hypothetical protein
MKSLRAQNELLRLRRASAAFASDHRPWNSKIKLYFKGADRRYQYLITAKVRSIASVFESHVPATLIHRP